MKTMIATLRLSQNLDGRTRERCPEVVFSVNDDEVAGIRSDVEQPTLPVRDAEFDVLEIRDDALSRVMDEPAWVAELARVITPGGELRLTLPASGLLAWLDALNLFRYAVDIGKRGDAPDAALPTGWNRHYTRDNVRRLLDAAGFVDIRIQDANYADREIRLLAVLMVRNWIGGDREAELEAYPRFGDRTPRERRFPIATTWSISARKPH